MAGDLSGISVIRDSVVSTMAATLTAFLQACTGHLEGVDNPFFDEVAVVVLGGVVTVGRAQLLHHVDDDGALFAGVLSDTPHRLLQGLGDYGGAASARHHRVHSGPC